jgi:hypothetical protein
MGFVKNVINGFVGNTAADASRDAADLQAQSGREGIAFQRETRDLARTDLAPFTGLGSSNIGALQTILTPQGQSDYLKQNPLFTMALDNLNRSSNNTFLGRGKLGDATNQLTKNVFLAGQPLLQQQTGNLFNAVNLGQSSAAGQANTALDTGNSVSDLITGIGDAQAAGGVGAANAQTAGANNVAQTAALAALFFSDRRLKRNIKPVGTERGYHVYHYQYLWSDQWYRGVMADEVKMINPRAVIPHTSGYDLVNYGAL